MEEDLYKTSEMLNELEKFKTDHIFKDDTKLGTTQRNSKRKS